MFNILQTRKLRVYGRRELFAAILRTGKNIKMISPINPLPFQYTPTTYTIISNAVSGGLNHSSASIGGESITSQQASPNSQLDDDDGGGQLSHTTRASPATVRCCVSMVIYYFIDSMASTKLRNSRRCVIATLYIVQSLYATLS